MSTSWTAVGQLTVCVVLVCGIVKPIWRSMLLKTDSRRRPHQRRRQALDSDHWLHLQSVSSSFIHCRTDFAALNFSHISPGISSMLILRFSSHFLLNSWMSAECYVSCKQHFGRMHWPFCSEEWIKQFSITY